MRHLNEYRDAKYVQALRKAIHAVGSESFTIMEVCGGQTHGIVKNGLHELLEGKVELIHGPGCPVCVTPASKIDTAIALASEGVIICTFGDMMRVPGKKGNLFNAKARGGDIRIIWSPLDAVRIATSEPQKTVCLFAVGFETTAPTVAMAAIEAKRQKLTNFRLLSAHVRVPPALKALLEDDRNRIQGFLAAGHVCSIMGTSEYHPLASNYNVPIVVTGFEPVDIMQGILMCIKQLDQGQAKVEVQYQRMVRPHGNTTAKMALCEVFELCDMDWRGLGSIPASGLRLKHNYRNFEVKTSKSSQTKAKASACIAGEILTGRRKPFQCPAFGSQCSPETPLGAPMVSSEGACAAWFQHQGGLKYTQGETHA